jgi:hypothetical protein
VSLFFLSCFVIGAAVLLLQLALGAFGAHGHVDASHESGHGGLDLLSVRALAAGAGFFGLAGYGAHRSFGVVAGVAAGLIAGFAAAYSIARLMRGMRRLEVDKSFDINRAIGVQGRVHLGIPASRTGTGKVHVIVHDRLMELDAVTTGPEIASGSDVLVTDVVSSDTVIVAHAQPLLSEISDVQ